MNDPAKLAPDQRTELVAYLDGELDDTATQEMERVLAESADARHDVDMLARTFALMDDLPRPGASTEFTAKTLTSLKAERSTPRWADRAWYRHARRGTVLACWVVGLALAAVTGYLGGNHLGQPVADEGLIRELPVIENLDAYSGVPGIEDVKDWKKHGVFNEENDEDGNQP